MKNVLITGASGFVGSFLVAEALAQGYQVLAGIRKTSSTKHLQQAGVHLVELNFADTALLTQQLQQAETNFGTIDYVVHNAGLTQANNPNDFFTVNAQYTRHFVAALQQLGHPLQKFVLISSLAAYGPGKADFQPITIHTPYAPITAYGRSKLEAELFVKNTADWPYVIINPTAVYGPRDKDLFEFVKLVHGGFEPYLGRHQQMITLIHVHDLARATIAVMGRADVVRNSYIVSDGNSYSKEELGAVLKGLFGKKTFKIKLPLAPIVAVVSLVEKLYALAGKRPFLNKEKVTEISSANWICESEIWNALQTKPTYLLSNGMQQTVAWYTANGWLK